MSSPHKSDSHAVPHVGECRVYWGSHGCWLPRGHTGEHLCACSLDENGILLPHMHDPSADPDSGNVGRAPYYGPDTRFYGEDAEALGLPLVEG